MTMLAAAPLILAEEFPGRRSAAGWRATEEYAAEELRRHLYAMAGAGPYTWSAVRARGSGPVISLNDRAAAQQAGIEVTGLALGREAFHLETRGNTLFILGGSPRGVLYGVYELLASLGCRWFTPELTHIPHRPTITLPPMCRTAAPAFEFRDMFNWEGSDPVWWARNRMNGWYTPVPEYMGGHVDYGLFVHTFYTLLPPEEFFAAHAGCLQQGLDGVRRHEWDNCRQCAGAAAGDPSVYSNACAPTRALPSSPSRRTTGKAPAPVRAARRWQRRKDRNPVHCSA